MPALTEDRWEATKRWHQVEDLELLRKWKYPWQMIGVMALSKPIPSDHPKGAVIWVNLSPANS
jgi:hypothetical protein